MLKPLFALLLTASSTLADAIVATSFPNLIVPIDSSQPDTPLGTQYSGHLVSPIPNTSQQIPHTQS